MDVLQNSEKRNFPFFKLLNDLKRMITFVLLLVYAYFTKILFLFIKFEVQTYNLRFLQFLILFFGVSILYSQTISGKIQTESGSAIPDVNVYLDGTKISTTSDYKVFSKQMLFSTPAYCP